MRMAMNRIVVEAVVAIAEEEVVVVAAEVEEEEAVTITLKIALNFNKISWHPICPIHNISK